jgi:hypothetical protein
MGVRTGWGNGNVIGVGDTMMVCWLLPADGRSTDEGCGDRGRAFLVEG